MIRHITLLALRNLIGRRGGVLPIIIGYAIAFLVVISIFTYVWQEVHIDNTGKYSTSSYRITFTDIESTSVDNKDFALSSAPIGPFVAAKHPEIREVVRIHKMFRGTPMIRTGARVFFEERFFAADPGFFNIFGYTFLFGDPHSVLQNPKGIIITKATALKLFDRVDVLGETIVVDRNHTFTIEGVLDESMTNSHFEFDYLASFSKLEALPDKRLDNWFNFSLRTYIAVDPARDTDDLRSTIITSINRSLLERSLTGEVQYTSNLQPLRDIHLKSDILYEFSENGSLAVISILGSVGLIILMIVFINAININLAKIERRASEVLIRRVFGSSMRSIVLQHWIENLILCFLALIIALLFLPLLWEHVFNKPNTNIPIGELTLLSLAILLLMSISVIPASLRCLLTNQRMDPTRGCRGVSDGSDMMRPFYALLVIQFCASIVLIISSLVVVQQIEHLQNVNYGLQPNDVVVLPYRSDIHASYNAIEAGIKSHNSIRGVYLTSTRPGDNLAQYAYRMNRGIEQMIPTLFVSPGFMETLPIEVIKGKLQGENEMGNAFFIANKTAAGVLGVSQIDSLTTMYASSPETVGHLGAIIADMPYQRIGSESTPVMYWVNPSKFMFVIVHIDANERDNAFHHIENTWASLHQNEPVVMHSLLDVLNRQYTSEQRLNVTIRYFALIALFLSTFGLFSVAVVQLQRRRRQVGIRKVLGASTLQIGVGLVKEYIAILVVANVLAWPIAWYILDAWLSTYPQRVHVDIAILGYAAMISMTIALAVILIQVVSTIRVKPVEILRYE